MNNTLQSVTAVWGALLATALGVYEIVKHFRDKPRIVVTADLVFKSAARDAEVKGTLIKTNHGTNEVLLSITASNHGRQPLQITACLVEEANGNLMQIIPVGLPALLEPNTRFQVEIQKEWLDGIGVKRFGVIDALGRIHEVAPAEVVQLVQRSNALPSNKREYRQKESGDVVKAFQVKDRSVLTKGPIV